MKLANQVFPVILYVLGMVLLVVLIILAIKIMGTIKRINHIVDDINEKSGKLNGVFDIVDRMTDVVSNVSDRLVEFTSSALISLFSRKNKKKEEESENE